MQTRFILFWGGAAVLSLGLEGCAPQTGDDRGATPASPVAAPDRSATRETKIWRVKPVLVSAKTGFTIFDFGKVPPPAAIDPLDEIVFKDPVSGARRTAASLRTQTECKRGNAIERDQREMRNVNSARVAALLPTESLGTFASEIGECSIAVTAQSENGSMHRFTLEKLRVQGFAGESGLTPAFADKPFRYGTLSLGELRKLRAEPNPASAGTLGDASLVCEKFVSTARLTADKLNVAEIATFSNARSRATGGPYFPLDFRLETTDESELLQPCRIVFREGGILQMSAFFNLIVRKPAVRISSLSHFVSQPPLSTIGDGRARARAEIKIFEFEIANDDATSRWIKMSFDTDGQKSVLVQGMSVWKWVANRTSVIYAPAVDAEMTWALPAIPRMDLGKGRTLIEVPARKSIRASISVAYPKLCLQAANGVRFAFRRDPNPEVLLRPSESKVDKMVFQKIDPVVPVTANNRYQFTVGPGDASSVWISNEERQPNYDDLPKSFPAACER